MLENPALARFRELLRIPTVSRNVVEETDWASFAAFRERLEHLYPLVHRDLDREIVAEHSLLYRWPGTDPDAAPTVLMAHQDVVPADEDGWTHPPFAAEISGDGDDARLWGRGTIDDKGMLVAILEAVEQALVEGVHPRADLWLSFGHDEETGGTGAQAIVALLGERGIRPGLVLDEGGAIVHGVFPGIDERLAVVGVSEKGIASVELAVTQQGGHASTPPRLTATARLARAIVRLTDSPAPAAIPEPTLRMLETLAPLSNGAQRVAFRNARRLQRPLARLFEKMGPETGAMVRTTRAVTRLSGSAADNVLAERATAIVNVRVIPGSTLAEALAQIERAVADPEVTARVVHGSEPSPVSASEGAAWQRVATAIRAIAPDAVPTPYVMLGASDARFFTAVSDAVYRFSPFELSKSDRDALHAIDESIRIATWQDGIRFFRELIAAS